MFENRLKSKKSIDKTIGQGRYVARYVDWRIRNIQTDGNEKSIFIHARLNNKKTNDGQIF